MVRKLISVGLVAAFLAWVAWFVSGNLEAFRPITRVGWLDALLLVIAFFAIMVGNGIFIAIVARAFGIRLGGAEWISLSLASSFANYFLPFRGGTGIRALYMHQVHGFRITEFVSTLSVMYLMHIVINGLIALAGMVLVVSNGGPANLVLMAFFAAAATAGVLTMMVNVRMRGDYDHFPMAQIARMANAWHTIRKDRALVGKLWLLMIGMTLATVFQCRTAFNAVEITLPWEGVLVYAAAKNLAGLIGLTPGALGVVELVSIYLGNVLGYSTADALTVQGLIRAVAIVSLLLAGPAAIIYLRRGLARSPATRTLEADG